MKMEDRQLALLTAGIELVDSATYAAELIERIRTKYSASLEPQDLNELESMAAVLLDSSDRFVGNVESLRYASE
ncbi:hypothetical protein [Paludibacterium purpuratum]|uniref:Uncharacterized protein n=1 Tax=Paludibacterium purpuratum TaxID=1144873 RepID=A0A4R7BDC7_9NEIS|nr:hypothetical protein [Paludibacterium purpuratum]TDR82182.1 hypothetical protein DFP86_102296 [Paludibacterium purpuratum]